MALIFGNIALIYFIRKQKACAHITNTAPSCRQQQPTLMADITISMRPVTPFKSDARLSLVVEKLRK